MYIGNTVITQGFTPQVDFFSGNASTTAFTLSRPVASTYQMIVNVANVDQNPGSAYTVSGNTITFSSAPPSGTNNIWVEYTSLITQTIVPTGSYQVSGPVYTGTVAPLGGATNPITGNTGSANNYIQTYIYNTYNGVNSSADFTAYPSNGSDASGWVDMGITGPTFSQSAYSVTGANEPYLFGSAPSGSGTSGNLVIATDSTGTTNAIQFYTGGFTKAKSAFAMMIDQNGNVGVGVTPPTIQTGFSNISLGYAGNFIADKSSVGGLNILQNAYRNSGGTYTYVGTAPAEYYQMYNGQHAWYIAGSGTAGNAVSFTQAMTLDNSGQFYVAPGSINANYTGSGYTGFYSDAGFGNQLILGNTYGNGKAFAIFKSGTSNAGNINQATSSTVNYANGSDRRLKENIAPLTTSGTFIDSLKPSSFTWIADKINDAGFIADEIQKVLPIAVHGEPNAVDKDGNIIPQMVDASHASMIANIVAELQSLRSRLKTAGIA